jgi:hypothetical protein
MAHTFKEFSELITDQIKEHAFISGMYGSGYLEVQIIVDNRNLHQRIVNSKKNLTTKIVGELLYNVWREGLWNKEILIELGTECQKFIEGKRETEPSIHWSGEDFKELAVW